MNPEAQRQIVKTVAAALNIQPEHIGNWMIHLETSAGTVVIHTLPNEYLYREMLITLIGDRPVPVEFTGGN